MPHIKMIASEYALLASAGWRVYEHLDEGRCGSTSPYSPSIGADIFSNQNETDLPENRATLVVQYEAFGNCCEEATFDMPNHKGKNALARTMSASVVSVSHNAMRSPVEQADLFAHDIEGAVQAEVWAQTRKQADSDPREADQN